MAVAAVAALVDVFILGVSFGVKQPLLVEEQCPQVVFQVEGGPAALGPVLLEFLPALLHHVPVFLRGAAHVPVLLGRAVPGKGEDVRLVLYHLVHQGGDVPVVPPGYGGHNGHVNASVPQQGDGRHGGVVGAGLLADAVVGLPQAVQGELVLPAAAVLQPAANIRREVEGVAHQREGDVGKL